MAHHSMEDAIGGHDPQAPHDQPKDTIDDVHHEGPHVVPLRVLFGIFAALMVLTAATVGITTVDFGYTWNLLVALIIALIKGILVGLYFMHLRYDAPLNAFILIISLAFVTLFMGITLMDTANYQEALEPPAIAQPAS